MTAEQPAGNLTAEEADRLDDLIKDWAVLLYTNHAAMDRCVQFCHKHDLKIVGVDKTWRGARNMCLKRLAGVIVAWPPGILPEKRTPRVLIAYLDGEIAESS